MMDFADRIRLFNYIKARGKAAQAALKNYNGNKNPTMEDFAEEMQMQGKALALMELAMEILNDDWPDRLSAYSDELTVTIEEQRKGT
jgi:hypothetical protein